MDTSIFKGNRQEYFEYELMSLSNGSYVHDSYITTDVLSGMISLDFSRDVIGTANFSVNDSCDIDYISDLIKPWYCMIVSGTTYRYPLGVYMLLSPRRKSNGKMISRNIVGYDLLYALEQDKITASVTYSVGENVTDLVETIIESVGSWVSHDIKASTETLGTDMSYEVGKSKLFIINSLLNTINYYPLWANGNGVYRGEPWTEEPYKTWEFEDNSESLYTSGIEAEIDYTEMYNKVVIITNQLSEDTPPLYCVLTFEDIGLDNHPFSYTSIGRYITKKFDSEAVSQSYVDLRAQRELLKMLEIEESINYNHAFVTARDEDGLPNQGDCFTFKNTLLDLNSTYRVLSQSYNLKVGSLVNSVIRRVTTV